VFKRFALDGVAARRAGWWGCAFDLHVWMPVRRKRSVAIASIRKRVQYCVGGTLLLVVTRRWSIVGEVVKGTMYLLRRDKGISAFFVPSLYPEARYDFRDGGP
jgi:hypothetical protein